MTNIGKRNTQYSEGVRRDSASCFQGCNVMCGGLCNCGQGYSGLSVSDKDSSGKNAYYGRNYVNV